MKKSGRGPGRRESRREADELEYRFDGVRRNVTNSRLHNLKMLLTGVWGYGGDKANFIFGFGFCRAFARGGLGVGGCPTAGYFLLLRQKKSNQRKGDPTAPPLRGESRLTEKIGRAPKLGLRPQTSAPDFPRFFRQGETGQRGGNGVGERPFGVGKTGYRFFGNISVIVPSANSAAKHNVSDKVGCG